jgi:hypothetical protein
MGAAFCMGCGGSVQPRPQSAVAQFVPEPSLAHATAAHSVAVSPNAPLPDNAAYNRGAQLARRLRSALPVVFVTLVAELLLLIILFGIVARPAKEAFDDFVEKTRDEIKNVMAIEGLAVRDAALLEYLGSVSSQIHGDADERVDRLAQCIRAYVAVAQKADLDSYPASFADVYKHHVSLWSDYADTLVSHPHIPGEEEAFVGRLLQTLTGNLDAGAAQQQEIAVWARRVQEAGRQADQGTQDFVAASKSAINAVGND